jgi:hypothetical protein
MRWSVLLAAAACLAGCTAVDQAGKTVDKAAVCAEALGITDLNPLVDPDRLRARAADKERRLRELAGNVSDQDVKSSLLTMADSYLEVQKERVDDATVVAKWAKRNAARLDALRKACG